MLCTTAGGIAADPALTLAATTDDALVLLAVRLGQSQLSDALPAQEFNGELYLPLGGLAALLGIGIESAASRATASGFILDPERSFYLDARAGTVAIAGVTENFDVQDIRMGADDIYVARRLISAWLPVDLEVDMPSLWLLVHPREPLPLQTLAQRERRAGSLPDPHAQAGPTLTHRATPYTWAQFPTVDQTLAFETTASGGEFRSAARLTAFATADLLQLEGAAFLTAASGRVPTSARLTLARHDPDNGLLGFLHANSISFGSVPMAGVANVTEASTLGSGFHISNYPLTRPERFDSQSLNGPLPPGWDVELYYNDGLVAWRQADSSGIYEFTDLPLEYGRNAFRLVFRGPQGQFRTEEQIFQVGDALVPAGELYYHVAAQPWADRGITSSAQLDWGLGSRLSLAGGVTLLHGDSAPFVSVGVRSAVAGSFVTADLLRAPTGDWAREFGLRTRVAGFGITATHKQLDGFRSDLYQRGNDLQSQSELRLSGGLPVFGARLPVDLEFRRDDRAGADNMQANLRLGAVYRGTAISNQLGWQSTGEHSELFGRLQFSRRFERFGLRAQITYGASGPDIIDDVSMTFDQRTGSGWLWSLGFDRSMVAQKSSLTASLNRSFESFSVGLQGGWSTDDVFAVGMNLFMSVGREPRTGTWKTGSAPTADSGAVSARVFLDGNLNGAFDGGEVLLSGVAFQVNGGRQQVRTGESGIALLQRLPVNQFVDVGVEAGTLEDPYWLPRPGAVRVVPRPGMALALDFPIVPTTEIDGVLYADFEGKRRALAGRRVELRAADGALIASTTSAGDGYYLLEAVPPGAWQLVVIGGDGETAPPPRVIHVDPAGDLINGVDIVFTRPGDTSGGTVASADTTVAADAVAAGAEAQERPLPPRRIAVDPGGVFAVQTGAFMSSANAERYAAAVTALGFEPRIEPFLDANKVRWYRVRVGRLDGLGPVLAATEAMRAQVSAAAIPVRLTQRP